jgi:hypothetical protein
MDALVSILKQETYGIISSTKIAGIDLKNSLHEFGKIGRSYGLNEKVKMIRHEAIMKDLDAVLSKV